MSLDQSPIPSRGGGWSSPGLTTTYDENSSGRIRPVIPTEARNGHTNGGKDVSWETAKAYSARVNGYPRQNQGFIARHMTRLSQSLPYFSHGGQDDRYAEKEKLGRGRSWRGDSEWRALPRRLSHTLTRKRRIAAVIILILATAFWFSYGHLLFLYRKTSWLGGGSKFVVILGANEGGGVESMKGAREWAIERDSVKNKKNYAKKWGYELEIVDLMTKKRYAHEWREGWEKVDVIRNAMKKYPHAEWFWWLDLNTFVMEPTVSLQKHIFSRLDKITYRDIRINNPLNIAQPPNGSLPSEDSPGYASYLDPLSLSPNGDGKASSINLIVPQDCGGFNLGSFMVRRSHWTDRLLDIWWDPVFYEQRHMEWDHQEQDALEYLYANQPWMRPHTAFIPQRYINAFPHPACGDDKGIPERGCASLTAEELLDPEKALECGPGGMHYQEKERDFLVNMAGCGWGRDCWGEMYNFRQLSHRLNRSRWQKIKDWWQEKRYGKQEDHGGEIKEG